MEIRNSDQDAYSNFAQVTTAQEFMEESATVNLDESTQDIEAALRGTSESHTDFIYRSTVCIPYPLPQIYKIDIHCDRDNILYIDAPNVVELHSYWEHQCNVMNISYLPSLQSCSENMLSPICHLLDPWMRRELDRAILLRDRYCMQYDCIENAIKFEDACEEVERVYLRFYHILGQRGSLHPPYKSKAKSAAK